MHLQTQTWQVTWRGTFLVTHTLQVCGVYSQYFSVQQTVCSSHTGQGTQTFLVLVFTQHGSHSQQQFLWWKWPFIFSKQLGPHGTSRHSQWPLSTHLRTVLVTG